MTKDGDEEGRKGGKETRDEEWEERRNHDNSTVSVKDGEVRNDDEERIKMVMVQKKDRLDVGCD